MRPVNAAFSAALTDPFKTPIYGISMLGNLQATLKSNIPAPSTKQPSAPDVDLDDKADYDSHFTAVGSPGTEANRHGDNDVTFTAAGGTRYHGSAHYTDNTDTGWTVAAFLKWEGSGFRVYWEYDTVTPKSQIDIQTDSNGYISVTMWNMTASYNISGLLTSGEKRHLIAKWEDGVGISVFLDGFKLTASGVSGTLGVDDIWNPGGFANHVSYLVDNSSGVDCGLGRHKLYTVALTDAECAYLAMQEMLGITVDDVTSWPSEGAMQIGDEILVYRSIDTTFNLLKIANYNDDRACMATTAISSSIHGETVKSQLLMSAGTIPGRSGDTVYHDDLSDVKTASQQITEAEGRSSLGTATFKAVDTDGFFTQVINDNSGAIRDKKIRIVVGFDTLTEDEFEVDFVGFVQSNKLNNDLSTYVVTAGDVQRLMRGRIALASTALTSAITGTPATITLDSVERLDPSGGYVRIDDEVIAYTGISGFDLTGLTRGHLNTTSADHEAGAAVKEIFEIQGNAINLMLQLYMSTGNGTNGTYDVHTESKGLGIDQDLFDISSFEDERDDYFSLTQFRFRITETINDVKTWVETEILRPLSAHLKIRGDGTVALSVNRPALPTESSMTFDKDNVDDYPSWDHNLRSVINSVTINTDHNAVTGDFQKQAIFIDATSISENGEARAFVLDQKGIHTEIRGVELVDNLESAIRLRFGDPAPQIKIVAQVEQMLGEVGDIVFLTHPLIPDLTTGLRGITDRQFQIVKRDADYLNGKMTYTLTDTNRSGKFCVIAPDESLDNPGNDFPDYLAAGSLDSQYAFIAGDDGKMSNGDDGCLVI